MSNNGVTVLEVDAEVGPSNPEPPKPPVKVGGGVSLFGTRFHLGTDDFYAPAVLGVICRFFLLAFYASVCVYSYLCTGESLPLIPAVPENEKRITEIFKEDDFVIPPEEASKPRGITVNNCQFIY